MLEIQQKGYLPFKQEFVKTQVPAEAGLLIVAGRAADGSYRPLYTTETSDLRRHLQKLLATPLMNLPPALSKHLRHEECYFACYVIVRGVMTKEVEKILFETSDPVVRLKIFHSN